MRILAIGSHIDDIEIGCGGTLALAVQRGHDVYMLVMSGSDYNDLNGESRRTAQQAMDEGQAAVRALDVKDFEVLDFPTKDVPYDSRSVEAIETRLRAFKPDTILTHWPHDTHQAHRATSMASISAARYFNTILFYEPMTPSGRSYHPFRPQVYVDLDPQAVQAKEAALRAHESQYQRYGKLWLEAVLARGVHRGYEIGVGHAECFETLRLQWNF